MLLNPNCSEVVAKLDVGSIQEAREILEDIGMKVIRYDPYISLYNGSRFNDRYWIIVDPKSKNSPDFKCHARLTISKASYYDEEGIWIDGSQHSQHQLYETIKRIWDMMPGIEFMGHDGGGSFNEIYDEWVDQGAQPIEDFQTEIRDEIKLLLRDPIVINTIRSFKAVDIAVNKKTVQQDKYKLIVEAIRKSAGQRKSVLIEKKKQEVLEWEEQWKKNNPGSKRDFKMSPDKELFEDILHTYDYQINGTLYLMITNKVLAQVFLQDDQKILDELEKMVSKRK
jgi:hypothetical protein